MSGLSKVHIQRIAPHFLVRVYVLRHHRAEDEFLARDAWLGCSVIVPNCAVLAGSDGGSSSRPSRAEATGSTDLQTFPSTCIQARANGRKT